MSGATLASKERGFIPAFVKSWTPDIPMVRVRSALPGQAAVSRQEFFSLASESVPGTVAASAVPVLQGQLHCKHPGGVSAGPWLSTNRECRPAVKTALLHDPTSLGDYWSVAGSRTVNVAPRPGPGLAAEMPPPCASTSALAMLSPMPEPPWLRSRAVSTR
jgi:hypothetical protein